MGHENGRLHKKAGFQIDYQATPLAAIQNRLQAQAGKWTQSLARPVL